MLKKKTKVIKIGAFWKVQLEWNGTWITLRDLYRTRDEARKAATFYAFN